MKEPAMAIEDRIDELLAILDRDVEHVQDSLTKLNELRSSVIKRDEPALCKLLENIRAETENYAANESKRQAVRKDLAEALGCKIEQVTLSELEHRSPKQRQAQLNDRKIKLRTLIKELKKEHLSTAMLLSESARFNHMLLRMIFDLGKASTMTYSPDGQAKRQTGTALMNLQF
jgi:flagellar biosynthesis/type III secretory pathway chaperone